MLAQTTMKLKLIKHWNIIFESQTLQLFGTPITVFLRLRTYTMLTLGLCIFLSLAVAIRAQMEGFIVGGSYAKIEKHPYAAFLGINCVYQYGLESQWGCGSSIINQRILLTVAHCLDECSPKTRIVVRLGNEDRKNGTIRSTNGIVVHAKYNATTSDCDIALIRMSRSLTFNERISRVAIMRMPPYSEPAEVAGWGLTNVSRFATLFS